MITDLEVAQWMERLYNTPEGNGPFDTIVREKQAHGINCGLVVIDGHQLMLFRGSVSPEDWFRDVMSVVPGNGDRPYGFDIGIRDSGLEIMKVMHEGLPVVVGGHSLGAPHADFFVSDFNISYKRLVLMGSPKFAKQTVSPNDTQVSYQNDSDYVCDFPLGWSQPFVQTHVHGGHDAFPNLFMYHHIQYYIKGIQLYEASHH